jgi:hypothetical protein
MRVFVPMSDEWINDPEFAKLALVPYRCGVPLARRAAAPETTATHAAVVVDPGSASGARAQSVEAPLTAVA